ncbi:DUF7224 domain-containing protein [Streptomyces sp. DT171]|uniref:DUF7224 domain-containing protein n=1 Tax=Streptomyces sp. DT171 TaxID=3416524 RepID=UPI003CF4A76D
MVWWLSSDISRGTIPAYWPDGTTVAAYCLFVIAPVCAACAAWEAGRLRKGGIVGLAPVRSRYVLFAQALVPVALLGLVAVTVSLTAVRLTMGHALGWPSFSVLGMITAVLVAHIVIGFAAGNTLPRLLAPALVLVADYLWIALPPTFNTMWVRHLTGHLETGVPVTEDLNVTSLVAPALLACGLAIGVILVSMARNRRVLGAFFGIICASSACAVSYSLVSDWGPSAPVVPRADAMECGGSVPQVCLPPELAGAIPAIEKAAVEVLPKLKAAGIDTPQNLVYVSRVTGTDKKTWSMYVSPFFSDDDARASIAEAALPTLPNCLENTDAYVGDPRSLRIWLQLTAGVPSTTVTYAYGPDAMKQVAPIRKLTRDDQTAWFHRNVALLERCEPAPETVTDTP